jgi:hypothetical protein
MAKYNIKAMYEYEGEVEADTPEQAETIFLNNLNTYYVSTESFDIELVEDEEDEEE